MTASIQTSQELSDLRRRGAITILNLHPLFSRQGGASCALSSLRGRSPLGRGTVRNDLKKTRWVLTGGAAVFVFLWGLSGFFIRRVAMYGSILLFSSFWGHARPVFWPGLAVSILFVALIHRPLVKHADLASYFSHRKRWRFVVQNSSLIFQKPVLHVAQAWFTI